MKQIEQAKAALQAAEEYLIADEVSVAHLHLDRALAALSAIEGSGEPVAWHKPGEFPPNPIPEHHILIGYSNRKDKDEDYSLRQLTMHPHKGPWADWYGCVPNPDRWAVIPIPDKHSARWFMPKRTPSLSVDEVVRVVTQWDKDTMYEPDRITAATLLRERLTKAITRS